MLVLNCPRNLQAFALSTDWRALAADTRATLVATAKADGDKSLAEWLEEARFIERRSIARPSAQPSSCNDGSPCSEVRARQLW